METHLLDAFLAPTLLPMLMVTNVLKQSQIDKLDLLYTTVALGTVLSAVSSLLQFHLNRYTRSRAKLTILTATLLTTISILAILGFHIVRLNSKIYKLPVDVRSHSSSATPSSSDVFRYHFFADLLPGIVILSQTQFCSIINYVLISKAKRSFTLGESSIVAQLTSAAYLTWALTVYSKWSGSGPFEVTLTTEIVLNLGIITFSILFLPSYLLLRSKATLTRYSLIFLSIAISYAKVQSLIASSSNLDPITWLISYLFATHQRISLFSVWLSILTACVSFSTSWSRMVGRTNSLVRKVFHLALCVVFILGYKQDKEFTGFAAGCIVIVMFLLELIRAWELKPLGIHLEKVCRALRGKWDNKYLTLSHIYLLVGIFLPFWVLPNDPILANKLALSCGLISVGVGDTAAAVVGTFLGRTKIRKESSKTVEGLLGNILAMVVFKLVWVGYSDVGKEFSFIMAAVLTSFVEATTKTCDNLILPLVMIVYMEIF